MKQSLTVNDVGYGVKKQLPALQRCLAEHPTEEMSFDSVLLSYSIEPDGSVDDVAIEGAPQTHEAFECMLSTLETYKFEPSEEGVDQVKLSVPMAVK